MLDLFGLPISVAAICDLGRRTAAALAPIHAEALDHARSLPANVDETGWREGRRRAWLWAAVTRSLGVFRIAAGRGRDPLNFLTQAIQAHRSGSKSPSLLPAGV